MTTNPPRSGETVDVLRRAAASERAKVFRLAETFDARSLNLSGEARALPKDHPRAAALRGKARGYAEAATTLRAAFSISVGEGA